MNKEIEKERQRITDAIKRLEPAGMFPDWWLLTCLRAIKLVVWDETLDIDEALQQAKEELNALDK